MGILVFSLAVYPLMIWPRFFSVCFVFPILDIEYTIIVKNVIISTCKVSCLNNFFAAFFFFFCDD
jgi:hypothetical protein